MYLKKETSLALTFNLENIVTHRDEHRFCERIFFSKRKNFFREQ